MLMKLAKQMNLISLETNGRIVYQRTKCGEEILTQWARTHTQHTYTPLKSYQCVCEIEFPMRTKHKMLINNKLWICVLINNIRCIQNTNQSVNLFRKAPAYAWQYKYVRQTETFDDSFVHQSFKYGCQFLRQCTSTSQRYIDGRFFFFFALFFYSNNSLTHYEPQIIGYSTN